jgi:lipoate-protein ligase A
MDIKIIPFSVGEPERNMETDTEITLRAEKEGKVILRWYGWKKLSLSFGYSQKKLLKE